MLEIEKPKRGRPATGKNPRKTSMAEYKKRSRERLAESGTVEVLIRLPIETLKEIDELASELEQSRSEIIMNRFDMLYTLLSKNKGGPG